MTHAKWHYVWVSCLLCCLLLCFVFHNHALPLGFQFKYSWRLVPSPWMLLTCFVTWVIVTWVTWVTLGRLTYIWHCAPIWVFYLGHRWLVAGRQDVGLFFCFRHTSDLNVWSWYIVNNKLMIWKIVLGLHSDRTTHIFIPYIQQFISELSPIKDRIQRENTYRAIVNIW